MEFEVRRFTSDAPDNSQSFYLPSTTQQPEVTYHNDNSFGYMDQVHEPENSYLYFENGHEPSEEENDVTFYPVLNQVYVPESQIYKVVHAVEYHGTTYFYESLEYFTVYRLCHTTTYTPPHVVDENNLDAYWPGENLPIDSEEQYIEHTLECNYQPRFVESLTTENNECLSSSVITNSFCSPEMDLDNSRSNNYWNATYVKSQCDIVEDYQRNTSCVITQENVIHSSEVYQNRYSEDIFTQNDDAVYYERVNFGWSQLRYDFNLEGGSVQDSVQSPVLSLEALEINAIKAHVKYRKDNMYLTALSGKVLQKQTIPAVEKIPVITEVKDEYPMIECSNKAIENNKSKVVQVNTCTTSSKKLCRRESNQVVENLTEIENSNHEDHVTDRSIGKFSKTLQRIDSAVRAHIRTYILSKHGKKWYEKESLQVLESKSFMKEAENKDYNGESNNGTVPKRKQDDQIVRPIEFPTTSMKMDRKGIVKPVVKMSLFKEIEEFFARTETKEISIKDHLTSFQSKELKNDTDKDNDDGFLDNKENTEKHLLTKKNGLLRETIEIPPEENTNADPLLHSTNVGKLPVINDERSYLKKWEDIRSYDNISQRTDLIVPSENNTAENTSISPLSEDVGINESMETATAIESENEPTKVHSQKPKKKRFQNFRKFLERLLCCCTKGPT